MAEEFAQEQLKKLLYEVRVEIAEAACTVPIPGNNMPDEFKSTLASYEYYRSDFGMNMVLPRGYRLEELRFKIGLMGDGKKGAARVIALDGWPRNIIREVPVGKGRVTLSVSKALKIIPIIGDVASDILDATFQWDYVWVLKKVEVSYSEGLTSTPEWYLCRGNINKGFLATIILRKARAIKKVVGEAVASWSIKPPGWGKPVTIEGDIKKLKILPC